LKSAGCKVGLTGQQGQAGLVARALRSSLWGQVLGSNPEPASRITRSGFADEFQLTHGPERARVEGADFGHAADIQRHHQPVAGGAG
jgi:hypothetical protein